MDCIFCKIVSGELPSKKVYEDDAVFAFEDIAPQAPVHIIVIPKSHGIISAAGITPDNSFIAARIFEAISAITKEKGIDKTGFRVVTNSGKDACQTVEHLHFHILGGEPLSNNMR